MTITTTGDADAGVLVKQSQGEYLHYALTVQGGNPRFAFGCAHRHRLSAENFTGHPMELYEWVYLRNPVDSDASDDSYGVSMWFAAATKYQLKIDHCAKDSSVIRTICNETFTSDDPNNDVARQSIEVFCV